MLKKRIIFALLYSDGYFHLSRNFRLQKVGNLDWLIHNFGFGKKIQKEQRFLDLFSREFTSSRTKTWIQTFAPFQIQKIQFCAKKLEKNQYNFEMFASCC